MPPKGSGKNKKKTQEIINQPSLNNSESEEIKDNTTSRSIENNELQSYNTTIDQQPEVITNETMDKSKNTNEEVIGGQDNIKKNMSAIEERLFNLRMKINQGRKANKDEVNEEYQRLNNKHKNYKPKQPETNNTLIDDGTINADNSNNKINKWNSEDAIMHQTAEQAEYLSEKQLKKEQNKATFGWQAFTVEAKHRAYEKQLKKLPTFKNKQSVQNNSNTIVSHLEENPLDYGKESSSSVSHGALERLSQHMKDRENDRRNHSKRRMSVDAHNVDYINDRNAAFNKKLKRSFDKYTVEIRQNLERGTAV